MSNSGAIALLEGVPMISRKQVDTLEKLIGGLRGIQAELGASAKKSPNDAVNTFKLGLVNEVIKNCNELLGKEHRPLKGFELFDADLIPTNSDVTFVVAQYSEALEKFRSDKIEYAFGTWSYVLKDSDEKIETSPPRRLAGG
jgi:hypothetical protein